MGRDKREKCDGIGRKSVGRKKDGAPMSFTSIYRRDLGAVASCTGVRDGKSELKS